MCNIWGDNSRLIGTFQAFASSSCFVHGNRASTSLVLGHVTVTMAMVTFLYGDKQGHAKRIGLGSIPLDTPSVTLTW